jgi:hypothetical protein
MDLYIACMLLRIGSLSFLISSFKFILHMTTLISSMDQFSLRNHSAAEILMLLGNLKVHSLLVVPVLSQLNPGLTFPLHSFNVHFIRLGF